MVEISGSLINELKEFIGDKYFWIYFNSRKVRKNMDYLMVDDEYAYDTVLDGIIVEVYDVDSIDEIGVPPRSVGSRVLFGDCHDYQELDNAIGELYTCLGAVRKSEYSYYNKLG